MVLQIIFRICVVELICSFLPLDRRDSVRGSVFTRGISRYIDLFCI